MYIWRTIESSGRTTIIDVRGVGGSGRGEEREGEEDWGLGMVAKKYRTQPPTPTQPI